MGEKSSDSVCIEVGTTASVGGVGAAGTVVKIEGASTTAVAGEVSTSAEAFIEERAQPGPDAPDILYHYTSAHGLIDILKSWEIWATSIRHLNDSSEYIHTLKLASEVPTNYLSIRHQDLDFYLVESLSSSTRNFGLSQVYVASFSGNGNLLSQWRAYCPPGNGYSIGFDRRRLEACAWNTRDDLIGAPYEHWTQWQLVECEYDAQRQRKVLHQLRSEAQESFDELSTPERITVQGFLDEDDGTYETEALAKQPSALRNIHMTYLTGIERVAPAFKDRAFAEELEWRIVSPRIPDRKPEFRAGRFSLIPYVRFKLPTIEDKRHVDRIIIGPTEDPELAFKTLLLMCDTLGISVGSIERSGVPFRHWDSKQS